MHLQRLSLRHFKNYEAVDLTFSPQINCFVGPNGAGKTNLLDAIYYLCLCKSYFNAIDSHNLQHQGTFFRLDATFFQKEALLNIICKFQKGKKKEISCNKVIYERFSEHIGKLPVVMIAPDDTVLIKGGSEERRKLLDSTLSQLDATYLKNLVQYNRILQQRNALLKQTYESGQLDFPLLQTYNEAMVRFGGQVHEKRQTFLQNIQANFQYFYETLSLKREKVACQYVSNLTKKPFAHLLDQSLDHDKRLQRTTQGIHKDDLLFTIEGFPLKKFGSQGQQKSYLLAIKLALYHQIATLSQKKPFLLLDDIFDKLDEDRLQQLLQIVTNEDFGQIFITDTQLQRLQTIFKPLPLAVRFFEIEKGKVKTVIDT